MCSTSYDKPRIFSVGFEPSNGVFFAGQLVNGHVYIVNDDFIHHVTGTYLATIGHVNNSSNCLQLIDSTI